MEVAAVIITGVITGTLVITGTMGYMPGCITTTITVGIPVS